MRELLASIKTPGDVATRRTSPADDLRLEVKGVGLPIASTKAGRLGGEATGMERDSCVIPAMMPTSSKGLQT